MDFTREPIIETVITPREGYRLVVRSSKSVGQEEHFVDAVEVVSFGNAFFFRSVEKPKPFIVPVSDYEVLEVREPRIVLKTPHVEGAVKIAGGKKAKAEAEKKEPKKEEQKEEAIARSERRRDRRRSTRRRRTGKEVVDATADKDVLEPPHKVETAAIVPEQTKATSNQLPTLLPPPSTLIRDDLARLRDSEVYKDAFYEDEAVKEPVFPLEEELDMPAEELSFEAQEKEPIEEKPPVEEKEALQEEENSFRPEEDNSEMDTVQTEAEKE